MNITSTNIDCTVKKMYCGRCEFENTDQNDEDTSEYSLQKIFIDG